MRDLIPARRTEDLVVRESGDETLVFDTRTDAVHCLPAPLASVWFALDSANTLEGLADVASTTEGAASAAIVSLDELGLLETASGFDRRKFLTRAGLVGVGAVGAITVLAPAAMAANTGATIALSSLPAGATAGKTNFTAILTNFSPVGESVILRLFDTTGTLTLVGSRTVTTTVSPQTVNVNNVTTTTGDLYEVIAYDSTGTNVIATSATTPGF